VNLHEQNRDEGRQGHVFELAVTERSYNDAVTRRRFLSSVAASTASASLPAGAGHGPPSNRRLRSNRSGARSKWGVSAAADAALDRRLVRQAWRLRGASLADYFPEAVGPCGDAIGVDQSGTVPSRPSATHGSADSTRSAIFVTWASSRTSVPTVCCGIGVYAAVVRGGVIPPS